MQAGSADIQSILADQAARFVQEQYSFDQRKHCISLEGGFSKEHWRTFAELGWLALPISSKAGGYGCSQGDIHVVMHQFGRGMVMSPYLTSSVFAPRLLEAGSPPLQDLIGEIGSGAAICAVAACEPRARYNIQHVATSATPKDGRYALQGEKVAVAYGHVATELIVVARTCGKTLDREGISLFALPSRSKGVSMTSYWTHDGGRASTIKFDNALATPIGTEGGAFDTIHSASNCAAAATCAEMTGAMFAVFEQTLQYLKTRSQFGTKIGSFQALQHRAVDMYMQCELAQSLSLDAARAIDELAGAEQDMLVSAAKWQIGEAAIEVAEQAIQLHGAMGMMDELPIGHYLKRITALNQSFGDAMHHQSRYRRLSCQ